MEPHEGHTHFCHNQRWGCNWTTKSGQHVSGEITKNLSAVTSSGGGHSKLTHKFSLVDIFMLFITKLFISPGELIVLLQTPTE